MIIIPCLLLIHGLSRVLQLRAQIRAEKYKNFLKNYFEKYFYCKNYLEFKNLTFKIVKKNFFCFEQTFYDTHTQRHLYTQTDTHSIHTHKDNYTHRQTHTRYTHTKAQRHVYIQIDRQTDSPL